jgi:hypothetical protein
MVAGKVAYSRPHSASIAVVQLPNCQTSDVHVAAAPPLESGLRGSWSAPPSVLALGRSVDPSAGAVALPLPQAETNNDRKTKARRWRLFMVEIRRASWDDGARSFH